MVNVVIWSSGRFQYCERLYIVYYKSALRIICAHSEPCFGDLIEQSGYLVEIFSLFVLGIANSCFILFASTVSMSYGPAQPHLTHQTGEIHIPAAGFTLQSLNTHFSLHTIG